MIATAPLSEFFEGLFGVEPSGFWAGPGRVNLIGEHTDYNDGLVLPFAIDRWAVAALRLRSDRTIRLATDYVDGVVETTLDRIGPAGLSGWSAYPLGVVWALGEHGADLTDLPGFDLALTSDVPVGAGLSSSAAIESAVGMALNEAWQLGLDRQTLARVGQRAENVVVGAPTGIMDQSASLLGAPDCAVFLDCRSLDAEVVPLGLDAAGIEVLVVDTRVSHAHADGGYASRRTACEAGARILGVPMLRDVTVADLDRARTLLDDVTFRRVRHVVTENQRVLDTVRLLRHEGPSAIGALLDASHASMRDDFEITVPPVDALVRIVKDAIGDAGGVRMTGGGFGGCVVTLVPHDLVDKVRQAVTAQYKAESGLEASIYVCHASSGAGICS